MKKFCGALLLLMALMVSLAGCTRNDGVSTNQYKARSTAPHYMNDRNGNIAQPTPPLNKADQTNRPDHRMAEKIAAHVSKVNGVDKSTVVVHNHDVLVGIDVKSGENHAKIADNVKSTVEKAEPGYKAHVTTDTHLHTRIQTMQQQMVPLDGHPIRNFTEDIGILIQDIGRSVTAPFR